MYHHFVAKSKTVGKTKEEQTRDRTQELQRRLNDVSAQLGQPPGSAAVAPLPGKKGGKKGRFEIRFSLFLSDILQRKCDDEVPNHGSDDWTFLPLTFVQMQMDQKLEQEILQLVVQMLPPQVVQLVLEEVHQDYRLRVPVLVTRILVRVQVHPVLTRAPIRNQVRQDYKNPTDIVVICCTLSSTSSVADPSP